MKISKHAVNSLGGLSQVYWALASSLSTLIDGNAGSSISISQSIVDSFFNEIEFSIEKVFHTESPSKTNQGMPYNQSVTIPLRDDRDEVRTVLDVIKNKKVVLLTKDLQQQWKLVGLPDQGLTLIDSFQTGTRVTDFTGNTLKFSGVTSQKSPFVTITS